MDNKDTDAASDRSEIDPQWEENEISENPPEVENGAPETEMLEPFFLPTIRNSGQEGGNDSTNIVDVAELSLGLFPGGSGRPQGHANATPSAMDGANSVAPEKPTKDSNKRQKKSVRFKNNTNKVPSESATRVSSRTDPQASGSTTTMVSPRGANYRDQGPQARGMSANNRGSYSGESSSPSHITPNHNQIDDVDLITPASPPWEDEETWASPGQTGHGQEMYQRVGRRTIRQRLASVRQTIREIAREDMEWVRGAMSNVGIRTRTPHPERGEEEASSSQPASRSVRKKAPGAFSVNLRGGIRPEHQYYDLGVGSMVERPPLQRPPPYAQPVCTTTSEQQSARPTEYIHPSARTARSESSRQNIQQIVVSGAAARDAMDEGSNTGRITNSRQSTQQHNNTSDGDTTRSSRTRAPVDHYFSNANGDVNERHMEMRQFKISEPISGALLDVPIPAVKKQSSISTFGRETGRKIKAKVSRKFSSLGRKDRQTLEEGFPEPEIVVREEIYATTIGTGKFRMWPFGKKKADVTTHF